MRQPIQLSALVHPDKGRSWLCSIRDFCVEGMLLAGGRGSRSLKSAGNIVVGEEVALHFSVPSPEGQNHYRTRAKVVRVLPDSNGVGVYFNDGMEDEVFDALKSYAVATGIAVPEVEEDEDEGSAGTFEETVNASSMLVVEKQEQTRRKPIPRETSAKLMQRLRAVTNRAATRLSEHFVKNASGEMLTRARDAGTNAVQARYLETLNSLEHNQAAFNARFIKGVVSGVEKVSDLDQVLERRRKRETGNTTKLELVDTNKFEHWLLLAEIISKAENRFKDSLFDMRAQMGELARPWSHKDAIPVGPSAVCWAFDDAQEVFDLRHDVTKEIFDIFEEALHQLLPNLYLALGKLFTDSGIFSSLEELRTGLLPKYSIRTRSGVSVTPAEYQDMDQNLREATMAADGVGRADVNPFVQVGGSGGPAYQAARSILDIRRRTREMTGQPREAGLAAADAQAHEIFRPIEVMQALNTIQQELGDTSLSDTRLKPRLLEVLRSRHGDDKGLAEEDFDTFEVMDNLVTSLTDDLLITEGVRDWVSRLEVTLNKLAATDPEFLASDPDNPHSAVLMLNQLARLGNSQDLKDGIDREVGRRVDELLQRVVSDYDSNPQVFSEVVDELHPLIDRQSQAYRGNVERTVRASEGQDKLARARRRVCEAVGEIIGDQEVPDLLVELLSPAWRNLLVHSYLRHGTDSYEWRDQLALVEQLLGQMSGAVQPGTDAWADPEALLRRVVEGLNSISYDPAKRTPLVMHLSGVLVGDAEGNKAPATSTFVSKLEVAKVLGLEELLPETDPEPEDDDQGEAWTSALDRARRIEVGEWLATSDKAGRPLILSVAFVGEDASNFVLVNRKGVNTMDLSLREMAYDLNQGKITLLDDYDLPLMERASQRMLENMHTQLAFQASHDDLTQLANRREFERCLEDALQEAKTQRVQHALYYMDLDQFKIINNTSGHRAGDELLRVVGEHLRDAVKHLDNLVSRLGGDEFGVLIKNIDNSAARKVADTLLESIRGLRFEWDERPYPLTSSMGLVFIDESSRSVENLMQFADEACFSAKDAGRNRLVEYELGDSNMLQRHGAMEWVTRLDRALEEDRLILNCQRIAPVSDLGNGAETHYEILLTMMDELGDVVPPTELISAAETYNRMTTVDRWVIKNVFAWMAEHRDQLDSFGGFAINVSGHSVNDTTFPDFVLEEFSRAKIPTSKITFEITETATIANLDNAIDFMNRMRIIGCKFSLDDFGTGLSSYSYLRNLPVDYVKIDGVFVRDISNNLADYAVVRSINEIGHYLGKQTIAEYVENDEAIVSLEEIGVDFAQGYGVARPTTLANIQIPQAGQGA